MCVIVLFHGFFVPAADSFLLFTFLCPTTATVWCLSNEFFIYCLTGFWAESLQLEKQAGVETS